MLAAMPESEQLADATMAFTSLQGSSAFSAAAAAASAAVENPDLVQQLDGAREKLGEQTRLEASAVATSAVTTMGLSVGYVVWLLRGGVLVSTVLSSLPAWRLVDPLPVLEHLKESDDDDDADAADDTLESLVARNNQAAEAESRDGEAAPAKGGIA
jgi:hypothetical protein